jgi:hypothetical protein
MKVTIQNGSKHGFSRQEIEAMIPHFPESWPRAVKQVVLYQGAELKTAFYSKTRTLGLFWPPSSDAPTKLEGIQELLLALSALADEGHSPAQLTKSQRQQKLVELEELVNLCWGSVTEGNKPGT